jgi:(2Fe-2S) ferredoxin
MAIESTSPYVCHVFVCTNDRHGKRKSCADGDGSSMRLFLKEEVYSRGWKGRVRVSHSGCLGLCESGPNVPVYPQQIWYSNVISEDLEKIIAYITTIIQASNE